jgi:hypothetical protein
MPDEKETSANKNTSVAKSTAVWAAALLVAANAAFLAWKPLASVDPESLPSAHTYVWWSTKEFNELKKAPDVVLLGSSMLMQPLARLEANHLGHDIDFVRHHRVGYIEETLKKAGMNADTCFNFGIPGGMISDNFIVARALLQGRHQPKVAVVALSMRDMMDNQCHCAGTTPAFRLLSRYTDIDDLVELSMPKIWQRFDYLARKNLYVWGKKLDLQVMLSEATKDVLSPKFSQWFPPSRLAEADPEKNLPYNLRSEVEFFPIMYNEPVGFNDNTPEYRRRYRSENEKLFRTQAVFLQKLADLLKERNIEMVLVNTPLTPENHALMPPGSYEKFRSYIAAFAEKNNVPLVDLDGQPQFAHTDYYDSAHMNGSGGKKMADAIIASLTSEPRLVAALKQSDSATQLAVSKKQTIK